MSHPNITLYALNFHSRAERVMWALEEFEIPYNLVRLDISKGELFSEEFQKLSRPISFQRRAARDIGFILALLNLLGCFQSDILFG